MIISTLNHLQKNLMRKTAKKYIDLGNYLWNSGMFMFKASIYLNELKKYEPEIFTYCKNSFETERIEITIL